jgi:hypothetical membrane protein
MTINFVNGELLPFAFLSAFSATVGHPNGPSEFRAGFSLFTIWTVGAALLAIFPTDVPRTPATLHGVIHLVVAILTFLGGAFGALAISINVRQIRSFAGIRGAVLGVAVLSVILCLLDLIEPLLLRRLAADYGGLVERLCLGSVLAWMGLFRRSV